MTNLPSEHIDLDVAGFFPDMARRYIAHTEDGQSIRALAREAGCHASTVLRQVRKLETLRDDPLVDAALTLDLRADANRADPDAIRAQLIRALRHLGQPGALLLFTSGVASPAIVQTVGEGDTRVLATVPLDLAAGLVMRSWLSARGGTTVTRYALTEEGRGALPWLVARQEVQAARGTALETAFTDDVPDRRSRDRAVSTGPGFESPLAALARRKDSDGEPFLKSEFVTAGERLFEDFALSGFGADELMGWDTSEGLDRFYARASEVSQPHRRAAITRTLDAIKDLGPGLSDVVLRCCCLREGLEAAEKRMGWSARSGKVVLRIALHRLSRFYRSALRNDAALIG